jgi:transposase
VCEALLKRQKNDAADAEAILEAVTRPSMCFVEVKPPEQQSELVIHRARMTLMRYRIELSNAIRAHIAKFGLAAPIGRMGLQGFIEIVRDEADERVPASARICLKLLADQLDLVTARRSRLTG